MSFQYMALFTGDYLRDTRHLTPEEHGVYLLLLMHCWDQKGPVPLDERRQCGLINARSGGEIESLRRVLAEFFTRMDDGWYNKRMSEEIAKCETISGHRRAGALEKARRQRDALRSAQAVLKQSMSNAPAGIPIPIPIPIPTTSTATRARKLAGPTDEHRAIAIAHGVDCDAEWGAYRDWLTANGRSHKDESAGFRNWLRRAKAPAVAGSRTERRERNMDILCGKVKSERVIEGISARVGAPAVLKDASDLREQDDGDVGRVRS